MDGNDRRAALGALLAAPVAGLAGAQAMAATPKAKPGSIEARLDRIESHQAIEDVLCAYARGWDRFDETTLRACFWPDSKYQLGTVTLASQDFVTKGLESVAKTKMTRHQITNMLIEIDGDRAISDCQFASHHRRANAAGTGEEDWFLWGRYVDRFERRDGVWKIAFRRFLADSERLEPAADTTLAAMPIERRTRRKPDDPVYKMLDDFHAGR